MKKGFSVGEAINFGWQKFKENLWLFISLTLLSFAIWLVSNISNNLLSKSDTIYAVIYIVISILILVLSIVISVGRTKIALRIYDKETPIFNDVFIYSRYCWKYLLAMILYCLLILLGAVTPLISGIIWAIKVGWKEVAKNGWYFAALLFFPWLVWAIQYQMVPILIIDKDEKIIDSFVKSTAITKQAKLDLVAFVFISFVVIIFGFAALFFGIIVAASVIWLAQIYVYRTLLGQTDFKRAEEVSAEV